MFEIVRNNLFTLVNEKGGAGRGGGSTDFSLQGCGSESSSLEGLLLPPTDRPLNTSFTSCFKGLKIIQAYYRAQRTKKV